jgi:hypothetical protein
MHDPAKSKRASREGEAGTRQSAIARLSKISENITRDGIF